MGSHLQNVIGAVVIGRNEGNRLIRCLRSLQATISTIVYVDSGSTDGSIEAAKGLGAHVVALTASAPFTAARARNAGFVALKALKSEIRFVQFVDGDCEVLAGWLESASQFLDQRDDVALVCGRRLERYPSASVYNGLCDLEWNTPVGEAVACGGDSLARTEALESVGGFRSQLIAGEEPELCLRLRAKGWKIWRLEVEMTLHDAAMMCFRQWWVRTVRGGHAFAEVAALHWRSPLAIWKAELQRSVFWGGLLPIFIGASTLIYWQAALAVFVYPLQIGRIALIRGHTSSRSWSYAAFMTLGKFAEFQGIITFYWRRLWGKKIELIEYK